MTTAIKAKKKGRTKEPDKTDVGAYFNKLYSEQAIREFEEDVKNCQEGWEHYAGWMTTPEGRYKRAMEGYKETFCSQTLISRIQFDEILLLRRLLQNTEKARGDIFRVYRKFLEQRLYQLNPNSISAIDEKTDPLIYLLRHSLDSQTKQKYIREFPHKSINGAAALYYVLDFGASQNKSSYCIAFIGQFNLTTNRGKPYTMTSLRSQVSTKLDTCAFIDGTKSKKESLYHIIQEIRKNLQIV